MRPVKKTVLTNVISEYDFV